MTVSFTCVFKVETGESSLRDQFFEDFPLYPGVPCYV